jgi:protocatechuate 3,4-dioxygenase beta subunit
MKQFISLLTAVIITATLHAQTKPGTISGTITDAANKPVDAATIQLLKAPDKGLVKTAVSDKAGNFSFDKIAEGKYLISISAVGFAKKSLQWLK